MAVAVRRLREVVGEGRWVVVEFGGGASFPYGHVEAGIHVHAIHVPLRVRGPDLVDCTRKSGKAEKEEGQKRGKEEKRKRGKVGKWESGKVGKWESGKVGKWGSGKGKESEPWKY